MQHHIQTQKELRFWVQNFLREIEKQVQNRAVIIALSGDLGSGKTTMVQECARVFKIPEAITSPTFVIQKEYETIGHKYFDTMIHIDAYRLKGESELEYLGWNEIIQKPRTIIFIEWPEIVAGISMPNVIDVSFVIEHDDTRTITSSLSKGT